MRYNWWTHLEKIDNMHSQCRYPKGNPHFTNVYQFFLSNKDRAKCKHCFENERTLGVWLNFVQLQYNNLSIAGPECIRRALKCCVLNWSALIHTVCSFHNLFFTINFSQFIFHNSFFTIHFSQFIFHNLFFTVYFSQFVLHNLFFTIYFSQFIFHNFFFHNFFSQIIFHNFLNLLIIFLNSHPGKSIYLLTYYI